MGTATTIIKIILVILLLIERGFPQIYWKCCLYKMQEGGKAALKKTPMKNRCQDIWVSYKTQERSICFKTYGNISNSLHSLNYRKKWSERRQDLLLWATLCNCTAVPKYQWHCPYTRVRRALRGQGKGEGRDSCPVLPRLHFLQTFCAFLYATDKYQ